jgi:hypothetical protein
VRGLRAISGPPVLIESFRRFVDVCVCVCTLVRAAGRASASPIIDLFITLLSMGEAGYVELLRQREVGGVHASPPLPSRSRSYRKAWRTCVNA